jgi:hypothetical protein
VSLIGSLEVIKLASVLQRIETHEKTGLLTIKQVGGTWVELYFKEGRLLYIGPLRTNATLADRLLYDGVISSQVYQEIVRVVGAEERSEVPFAKALMEHGFATQEQFRAWATQKACGVLQVLLSWTYGEIHFEEYAAPAPERLLVALSPAVLLAAVPEVTPASPVLPNSSTNWLLDNKQPTRPIAPTPKSYVARIPTLTQPEQFFSSAPSMLSPKNVAPTPIVPTNPAPVAPQQVFSPSPIPTATDNFLVQEVSSLQNSGKFSAASLLSDAALPFSEPVTPPSQQVVSASTPSYIDISYMQPEMILLPADLSAMRDSRMMIQLTPDHWRLLTLVDGQTTLRAACQIMQLLPESVCRLAGELIAQKVITLTLPSAPMIEEVSPVSREIMASGLGNGYVAPGFAAATTPPLSVPFPSSMPAPQQALPISQPLQPISLETESQWGNGGNGATFIPGRGWVTPTPSQQSPSGVTGSYARNYVSA